MFSRHWAGKRKHLHLLESGLYCKFIKYRTDHINIEEISLVFLRSVVVFKVYRILKFRRSKDTCTCMVNILN